MPRFIAAIWLVPSLIWVMSCSSTSYSDTSLSVATVEIVEIEPEPESTIDRSTKIAARVRYSIDDFKPDKGRYELSITFGTTTPGNTFRTHNVNEGMARLTAAQGEVDLSYRLSSLKKHENLQLAVPVQVRFIVTEKYGPKGRSKIIGFTEFVTFPM